MSRVAIPDVTGYNGSMDLLVAGLVGVLVGAVAATGSVLLVLRRQGDRDLIERRLRACSRYRDCLGDLTRVLDGRGEDSAVLEQAWKNVADFCHEYRLSSWLFENGQRQSLDTVVEELEVAEALYRSNGFHPGGGTTTILTEKYREVDLLLGRELQRQSREFHSFRLLRRKPSRTGGDGTLSALALSMLSAVTVLTGPMVTGFLVIGFLVIGPLVTGSVVAGVDEDEDEDDAPSSSPSGISAEELARRVELLADWVYEPVALRGDAFTVFFDRTDSSFYLEDQRTRVRWYSSWGRRGFASLLMSDEEEPDAADKSHWVLLDRVEQLAVTDKRVRFQALSGSADGTRLDLTLELLGTGGGLSVRYEVPTDLAKRVRGVRLLENAFWIGDAETEASQAIAGAVVPESGGEWLPVAGASQTLHFGVAGGWGGVAKDDFPLTLPFLALAKAENVLHVSWGSRQPVIHAVRDQVAGDFFPGRTGLFFSVDFVGASAGELRIVSLGREEFGFVGAARAQRESTARDAHASLRFKSSKRKELRTFPSAPLLRASVATGKERRVVADLVARLRGALELDRAVVVLSDWEKALTADSADGDVALPDLVARIKAADYLLGLDVRLDAPSGDGFEDGIETLPDLKVEAALHEYAADVVLLEPTRATTVPPSLCQALSDELGLVGLVGPHVRTGLGAHASKVLSSVSYLEGFLDSAAWTRPGRLAWPLFSATFGQSVRIGVQQEDALRPGDLKGFLAHLLLGEAASYDVSALVAPAGAQDGDVPFAADEGWTAGRGLSAAERFLKNTVEVTSHLSSWRYRMPLLFHRALTPDGSVRETFYGPDLRVLVNFGPTDFEEDDLVLPPGGFLVKYPFFLAFYAKRMHGMDYERPAFFTVRSLEGKMYLRAKRVRLYHGFGPNKVRLGGKTFEVDRESVVKIW